MLVCRDFPRSSCTLSALGVLLFPGPVIIVLDSVKSTLDIINREVPPSSVPHRLDCGII